MKKKIVIAVCLLFILVLVFSCYKFFVPGNNKSVKDVNELDDYILGIKNYNYEAKVVINSNKNTNTYWLEESKDENCQIQKIHDDDNNNEILIENKDGNLSIKNTDLGLSKVFEKYENLFNNPMSFDSFIDDYKEDNKKEIVKENDLYIVSIKCKNGFNKYTTHKVLYFNGKSNQIEKMEVKDINNNKKIIIEYSSFKLL